MRLICPNCDAQYEVDDAVIPDDGRDVQCSNCGHTWFQKPAHLDAELSEELAEEGFGPAAAVELEADDDAEEAPHDAADAPDPEEAQDGYEEEDDTAEAADDAGYEEGEAEEDVALPNLTDEDEEEEPVDEEYEDASAPIGQSVLAQRQRTLDESILGILKEEAEREALARQREAQSGLETQGDLGLGEPEEKPSEPMTPVQERTARLRGIEPAEEEGEETRKDLLPDIEEINSSLRPATEREGAPEPLEPEEAERAQRRGFRIGFSLMIFLIVILICAYAYAPTIIETVPESQAAMGQYVDFVNESRVTLNGWMSDLAAKLSSLGGGSEAVQ
ncbi:hypothetical protein PSA7680_03382 [Pseudoruegeria aquimaris]|uniref:Zinc finger/thioredoxin putative domain-containing protein n=1 Tax=Pseudoruegeria aquimaris TaxID=393663 RepID=A0A1Y5TH94_9RHOB|nr:zinc-ribbon domain-containing protein [Pseudoruegeria aquimaris]SLN64209.1 hypothetical protein PSA7680_03382 [Pseudoruegeria aquimaris]